MFISPQTFRNTIIFLKWNHKKRTVLLIVTTRRNNSQSQKKIQKKKSQLLSQNLALLTNLQKKSEARHQSVWTISTPCLGKQASADSAKNDTRERSTAWEFNSAGFFVSHSPTKRDTCTVWPLERRNKNTSRQQPPNLRYKPALRY